MMTHPTVDEQVVFSIALVAAVIYSGWVARAVMKERRSQIMKIRSYPVVIATFVSIMFSFMSNVFRNIFLHSYPCVLWLIFQHEMMIFVICCYFGRAWMVWFYFSLTKEKIQDLTSPDRNCKHRAMKGVRLDGGDHGEVSCVICSKKKLWYYHHQYLATSKAVCIGVFAASVLFIVPSLIAAGLESSPNITSGICSYGPFVYFWNWAWLIVVLICGSLAVWKFRQLEDAFCLKYEFKWIVSWTLGIYIAQLAVFYIAYDFVTNDFPLNHFLLTSLHFFLLYYSFHKPAKLAAAESEYKRLQENSQVSATGSWISGFEDKSEIPCAEFLARLLISKNGLEAFTEHMIREFAVENVQFYSAMKDLEEQMASEALPKEETALLALQIYALYISPRAVREINLPYEHFSNIVEILRAGIANFDVLNKRISSQQRFDIGMDEIEVVKDLEFGAFLDAKQEIFNLMLDSVSRFIINHEVEELSKMTVDGDDDGDDGKVLSVAEV